MIFIVAVIAAATLKQSLGATPGQHHVWGAPPRRQAAPSGSRPFGTKVIWNTLPKTPWKDSPLRTALSVGAFGGFRFPWDTGPQKAPDPSLSFPTSGPNGLRPGFQGIPDATEQPWLLDSCPGRSDKCVWGYSQRICVQLLDGKGEPLTWEGKGNVWEITNVGRNLDVIGKLRTVGGDSWCLDNGLTDELIQNVGCENLNIRCKATDLGYVLSGRGKAGKPPPALKECLLEKCVRPSTTDPISSNLDVLEDFNEVGIWSKGNVIRFLSATVAGVALSSLAAAIWRRNPRVSAKPILG